MKNLKGKKVLITGAAGGIGLTTAENFARAGSELIITDIDAKGLKEAADKLRRHGVTVHTRQVDVSDKNKVFELARWVVNELGGLDILINNAGIGHQGELAETSLETWEKLLKVNFWGTLYHTYAFLPHMIEKRSGNIVNISSGQAFFRLPTWGAYAVVKLMLGAFSEILHFEVKKYGIKVTTVYPFMVNTPFYKDVEGDTFGVKMSMKLLPLYSMTPEKVGKIIFKALRRDQKVEMVSIFNDFAYYSRFIPLMSDIVSMTSNFFLAKEADKYKNPFEAPKAPKKRKKAKATG